MEFVFMELDGCWMVLRLLEVIIGVFLCVWFEFS